MEKYITFIYKIMYSKIIHPLNNQVYPVYSFQGKKLLKEYIKKFNGGGEDIFNVPLSNMAKKKQQNKNKKKKMKIKQQQQTLDEFDQLDQDAIDFINKIDTRRSSRNRTSRTSISVPNLTGIRNDLNKLTTLSNQLPPGFKEEERDFQRKFRLVEGYLEEIYIGRIDDSETIRLMDKIDNKIKRQRNLKFVPFDLFKDHFEKLIKRKQREKRRQLEIQKQTKRRQRQIKYVRHRNPNQPPFQ